MPDIPACVNRSPFLIICSYLYTEDTANPANYDNRYDVTILVNGLPLVHIELKRRGVAIREAFNQIDRYQRDSFWSGCGLYEYVQICFDKKVFVKSTRSGITLLFASAQKEVP